VSLTVAPEAPVYAPIRFARRRAPAAAQAATGTADAFPHTRRPFPWLLAGFLAMVYTVPIDSAIVKIHLPVDSGLDRFAVIILVGAWWWFGGDQRAFNRTRRSKLFVAAVAVFVSLAVASDIFDVHRLIILNALTLPIKQFAILLSFVAVGWFAFTALRYEDVRGLATWLIILGTITAAGMIVERQTGYNVFYNWSRILLKPIAIVPSSPTVLNYGFGSDGRVSVLGPMQHPLAATVLLVMTSPFAIVRALDAGKRGMRIRYGLAGVLMLMAAMATDRKSAFVVPVVMFIYLICYRPRQILKWAPIWLPVLAVLVHFAAPGAIGHILDVNGAANSGSTTHRLGDFSGISADVNAHPILGRGFGSIDADKAWLYRINDNQYLDILWATGIAGLLSYAWVLFSPVFIARKTIRARIPVRSSLALAGSAACLSFFVANLLFDAFTYPQNPYLFFVIAAMTVITCAGPEGNVEPVRGKRVLLKTRRVVPKRIRTQPAGTARTAAG
jgi:hypothetical protein